MMDGSHTAFSTSHNFRAAPERSIRGSSWAGGGREETCWTRSHWIDTNTEAVIAGQEASLLEFIWLTKKITLLLFHDKFPTLEGENIHAELNIYFFLKRSLIYKTWNFKHLAVMKCLFHSSSSISGRFYSTSYFSLHNFSFIISLTGHKRRTPHYPTEAAMKRSQFAKVLMQLSHKSNIVWSHVVQLLSATRFSNTGAAGVAGASPSWTETKAGWHPEPVCCRST